MVTPEEMRNGLVGVAVSFVILALGAAFFHDSGEGVWYPIVMFAFASALVVAHALDALERRRKRNR